MVKIRVSAIDFAKSVEIAKDTAEKRNWLLNATQQQIDALPVEKMIRAFHFAASCIACEEREIVPAYKMLRRRMGTL